MKTSILKPLSLCKAMHLGGPTQVDESALRGALLLLQVALYSNNFLKEIYIWQILHDHGSIILKQ